MPDPTSGIPSVPLGWSVTLTIALVPVTCGRRSVLILCVGLYVGGALLGFDAYDTVCISAHWVVQRGQGAFG